MTADAMQLPEAPGISGLRFRAFREGRDFHHMANITRVSAEVDSSYKAGRTDEK